MNVLAHTHEAQFGHQSVIKLATTEESSYGGGSGGIGLLLPQGFTLGFCSIVPLELEILEELRITETFKLLSGLAVSL